MLSKVKLYRGTIVIYYSKKGVLRHNTGIRIDEKDFSESKLILKSSGLKNYKEINDSLVQMQRRTDAVILQLKSEGLTPTVALVKERLTAKDEEHNSQSKKAKTSVIEVMEDFYSMKKGSRIKSSSLKVYRALINALKDYETSINDVLQFKDVDRKFLQSFEYFLTQPRPYGSLTEGNLNDNTIAKRYKVLREFWRYAVHEEIAKQNVDLESYKISGYETDIIIVSEDELRTLLEFETNNERERKVLDVFLFGCMTGIKSYEEFISSIQSKKEEDIETAFWTELKESSLSLDDYLSNINESAFKRILGGLTGLAFGRLIGRILIKSLGLKPNGVLGKILSSRTVHIAIGAAFGKK